MSNKKRKAEDESMEALKKEKRECKKHQRRESDIDI